MQEKHQANTRVGGGLIPTCQAPNSITVQTQSAKHPAAIALRIAFVFFMVSGSFMLLLLQKKVGFLSYQVAFRKGNPHQRPL